MRCALLTKYTNTQLKRRSLLLIDILISIAPTVGCAYERRATVAATIAPCIRPINGDMHCHAVTHTSKTAKKS